VSQPRSDENPGQHRDRPEIVPPRLRLALTENLTELRRHWFWFLLFGAALILLGLFALSCSYSATLATVFTFGVLLLVGGLLELIVSFYAGSWGGFFLALLAGVLTLVLGFIMINHPGEIAVVYTLILAVVFMASGLVRVIGSLMGRFQNWGMVLLSGIVTFILGLMVWRQWPYSGLWVIGLFVGIDLIFYGWAFVSLALRVRNLPLELDRPRQVEL